MKYFLCFVTLLFNFILNAQDVTSNIAQPTSSSCDNGSIDIIINNGAGPFDFKWSNGETTEDLDMLYKGEYSLTITDATCKEAHLSFNLECCNDVSIVLEDLVGLSRCGSQPGSPSNDGSISIKVQNSLPEDEVILEWSGPDNFNSSSASIDNLMFGTYIITATVLLPSGNTCVIEESYDLGCCSTGVGSHPVTGDAMIVTPEIPEVTFASVIGTSNGNCNGLIYVLLENADYFYWTSPDIPEYQSENSILFSLCNGTYCLNMSNGCELVEECYEVNDCSDPDNLSFEIVEELCPDSAAGTVASNGQVKVTSSNKWVKSIVWSDGQTGDTASGLAEGVYSVTVTVSGGCEIVSSVEIKKKGHCLDKVVFGPSRRETNNGITTLYCSNLCFCNGVLTSNEEMAADVQIALLGCGECYTIQVCPNGDIYNGSYYGEFYSFDYNAGNYKTSWAIIYNDETQMCECFADQCPVDGTTSATSAYNWEPELEETGLHDEFAQYCLNNVTCSLNGVSITTTDWFYCEKEPVVEDDISLIRGSKPSDIGEFFNQISLGLYPCPANEQITVNLDELDNSINYKFNIFSIDGIQVKDFGEIIGDNDKVVIDISDLRDGIYILKVWSGQNTVYEKFFKQ